MPIDRPGVSGMNQQFLKNVNVDLSKAKYQKDVCSGVLSVWQAIYINFFLQLLSNEICFFPSGAADFQVDTDWTDR